MSSTDRALARAAASSIASGSPSTSPQIRATVRISLSVVARSRRRARPRSRKRRTEANVAISASGVSSVGVGRGSTARSTSPGTPSGVRLVAMTRTYGHARSTAWASSPHAVARCSQLSSRINSSSSRRRSTSPSRAETSGRSRTPSTPATALGVVRGSASAVRSHEPDPAGPRRRPGAVAASSASRVLPAPPAPVSVTRR